MLRCLESTKNLVTKILWLVLKPFKTFKFYLKTVVFLLNIINLYNLDTFKIKRYKYTMYTAALVHQLVVILLNDFNVDKMEATNRS